MHDDLSRRLFLSRLVIGGSAALTASALTQLAAAHEHAAQQVAKPSNNFEFFTPREAQDLAAMCEQIIPSDADAPGAREAGAVYFIDYAVGKLEPNLQPLFREGLRGVSVEAAKVDPAKAFHELTSEQQITILKSIEKSEFFQSARTYTIFGFLGDPKYGGNRDKVGWKYIGFDDSAMFEPPFGYYDAELLASQKKEGN